MGEEAGAKKLETIKKLSIPQIDEDGLFKLIRELPANGGDTSAGKAYAVKAAAEAKKIQEMAETMGEYSGPANSTTSGELWTDKYAPTSLKDICGNKGQVLKLQNWLGNWCVSIQAIGC